jgi:hypothetical protein
MSTASDKPKSSDAGEQHYFFVCLAALLVVQMLVLTRPRPEWWLTSLPGFDLWPVLLGAAGLLLRWRLTPVAFLVLLSVLLFPVPRRGPDPMQDLILCGGVLAFVIGHYRLQALQHFVFPRDPRIRGRGRIANLSCSRRRPGRLVSLEELSFLLLTVLLWVGLAPFGTELLRPTGFLRGYNRNWWQEISDDTGRSLASGLELFVEFIWQISASFWLLGGGVLLVSLLLAHLAFRRQRPEEAALFLQDLVWKETRREQARLNRWLAWARLRQERRKERP